LTETGLKYAELQGLI